MKLKKNKKSGISILFLILLLTTSISFITFKPKNNVFNENSVSLSAPEDSYEENDDPSLAYDIRFNEANWLSSHLGNGTLLDDDWYLIDLDPGEERLRVILLFNHIQGNIDVEVYNSNHDCMEGNYSMDDNEFLEFDLFPSGDYYLRIFGDNASNTYDLWWEDLMPFDDPFEENDDFNNAAWVHPNLYPNLKIIDYDEDWFKTYLNSGETIEVRINFTHDDGNLELELYDPNHSDNLRVGSYSDTNNEEFILFTADYSGEWRIHVYRISGSIDVSYDLDIWLFLGDDWMEDNDDYLSARWVEAKYYPDLMIMGNDEDWFKTYLNSDDTIDIKVYFENYQGDLQLELYDPNDSGNLRDESYSSANDESISFTADISGEWRIRIYQVDGNSDVRYNLDIWINGEQSGDDPYEPNNHFDEAYDLHDDEHIWLSNIHGLAVQGDEDWYRIDVTPGFQNLIVNLKFNRSRGNINADIYKLEGTHSLDWNPIYSNYSMTGDDNIDINCSYIDPGIYMIQVRGDFKGLEYDMWWDDLRTDNRPDDNYEENDNPMIAYDLTFHQSEPLWRINGTAIQKDNDWYKIHVDSGFEHLYVLVIYDYQEGAIGIEIFNWDGSKVTSNFTMKDNEYISYDLPSNGTYYIRIFGDHSGNIYSLLWKTREPNIEEMIPGYDIFILLVTLFGFATVILIKNNRRKYRYR